MSSMFDHAVEKMALRTGGRIAIDRRATSKGVVTGWCRTADRALLVEVAAAVSAAKGRLSTITPYVRDHAERDRRREVAYHFDLDGATLTLTMELPMIGARLPSLTPIFGNADWNERELMELYDVVVEGHPNPVPLFVDRSIGPAAFEKLIPFSTFTNGANSKDLWAKVLAQNPSPDAPEDR